jgi:hypothetical protein
MDKPKKTGKMKLLDNNTETSDPSVDPIDDFNSSFKKYAARIAKGPDIGFETEELENIGWKARKNAFSGSIFAVTNGQLTVSGKFHARAEESDTQLFNRVKKATLG